MILTFICSIFRSLTNRFVIHWFYYRDERFCIIQSFDLFEVANHSSRLITQHLVVFYFLDLVNSFVAKYSSVFEKIRQNSDFIDQKKFVFVFHDFLSLITIKIIHNLFVRSRFWNMLKHVTFCIHFIIN
jgi:hypothetical protein